jgi:hemerythrin-like metal-binding protein
MVELTETFVLECAELDKDHKRLVAMVNDITDDIDKGVTGNCNSKVLNFVNFAKEHFSREEKLLKKNGYPEAAKHHKHHQTLIAKMEHIQEFAASAETNQLACVSLKRELVYFLMDDLITTDMDFKDHIDSDQD